MPLAAQEEAFFPTTEWRTSTPEEQGMNSAELAGLFANFSQAQHNFDSMLVLRNGYIVAEAYAPPFEQDMRHHLYSASKSVTSTLIGILLQQGYLENVDTPVLSLFPDHTVQNLDASKEAMTVRDLMLMAAGFQCDHFVPGWNRTSDIQASEDWLQFALDIPMAATPGTEFHYCNPTTYLLSAIITELTGMSALDFAAENLFAPLGITDFAWASSPQGISLGYSDLKLTTRDMAKIGYLYLRGGVWEGQQILPADFVTAAISPQLETGWPGASYGYQWWYIVPAATPMALGRGGQYIVLSPDKDLVVVFTGAGINETIRPYIQGYPIAFATAGLSVAESALPENADALGQLQDRIAQIENPVAVVAESMPDIAAQVSGQNFMLLSPAYVNTPGLLGDETQLNFNMVRFEFTTETLMNLTFTLVDGQEWVMPVGLDGRYAVSESPVGLVGARGEWHTANEFCLFMQYVGGGKMLRFDVTFMPGALELHVAHNTTGAAYIWVGVVMQQ
jgi:CubicO group peptidase (beta-lactamase class C family)